MAKTIGIGTPNFLSFVPASPRRPNFKTTGRQTLINPRLRSTDDGAKKLVPGDIMGFEELEKAIDLGTPKAKEALEKLSEANERLVEAELKRDILVKEMEKYDLSAQIKQAEKEAQAKGDKLVADAELAASEKLLEAAELRVKLAEQEKKSGLLMTKKEQDRIQSAKAGVVGAVGGIIGFAPILLTSNTPLVAGIFTFLSGAVSCGLFGITYRYAVSSDLSNRQLKTGVIAAFSVVRGLAETDAVQLLASKSDTLSTDTAGLAVFALIQSLIIFGFAAVSLEASIFYGFLEAINNTDRSEG